MPENNNIMSLEGQLVGMPLAGPESFSQQQLDYLKRALGVDETVLFEDTGTIGTHVSRVVLSETSAHFSTLEITLGWSGGSSTPTAGRLIFRCNTDGKYYGFSGFIGTDAENHFILGGISANGTSLGLKNVIDMYSLNLYSVQYQPFNGVLNVFKVVGIHRIAGGK